VTFCYNGGSCEASTSGRWITPLVLQEALVQLAFALCFLPFMWPTDKNASSALELNIMTYLRDVHGMERQLQCAVNFPAKLVEVNGNDLLSDDICSAPKNKSLSGDIHCFLYTRMPRGVMQANSTHQLSLAFSKVSEVFGAPKCEPSSHQHHLELTTNYGILGKYEQNKL